MNMLNTEVLSVEPEVREDRTKGELGLMNMHHICYKEKCGIGPLCWLSLSDCFYIILPKQKVCTKYPPKILQMLRMIHKDKTRRHQKTQKMETT